MCRVAHVQEFRGPAGGADGSAAPPSVRSFRRAVDLPRRCGGTHRTGRQHPRHPPGPPVPPRQFRYVKPPAAPPTYPQCALPPGPLGPAGGTPYRWVHRARYRPPEAEESDSRNPPATPVNPGTFTKETSESIFVAQVASVRFRGVRSSIARPGKRIGHGAGVTRRKPVPAGQPATDRAIRPEAKPVPATNRISGPKTGADARPVK